MNYTFTYKRDKTDDRDFRFSGSVSPHPEIVLPRGVDIREECPPIYDQGELGSCTANAGCTCRAMLLRDQQVSLSRMFLYYAERALEGTVAKDEGASLRDTCKSIHNAGVCEEKFMPYNPEKYTSHPSKAAIANASKYRITAYKSLGSLDEIRQNLAFRQQPVLLGMDVYESFKSDEVARTGIMPMPRKSEENLGGHAVLAVGYKDMTVHRGMGGRYRLNPGYLIVRNSWGAEWGDGGYFYMPYGYVTPEYTYDYWIME